MEGFGCQELIEVFQVERQDGGESLVQDDNVTILDEMGVFRLYAILAIIAKDIIRSMDWSEPLAVWLSDGGERRSGGQREQGEVGEDRE